MGESSAAEMLQSGGCLLCFRDPEESEAYHKFLKNIHACIIEISSQWTGLSPDFYASAIQAIVG